MWWFRRAVVRNDAKLGTWKLITRLIIGEFFVSSKPTTVLRFPYLHSTNRILIKSK
ncbi:hypothetical protein SBF1_2420009 [Candidatus Desulfosporosinus infrequens]|uniref:Uncharacterized protein n=1 Tax=Candidatus Desulfosporosinus infrequens TaxID=2043169 RepID=A0A2U3KN92_9FIRM|nr:hypothetical protein SBF1_2420009 [Candidatus Desulfosporosinus infrequens]